MQIQGNAYDLAVAHDFAIGLCLDLPDKIDHRLRDFRKVHTEPFAIEFARHPLVIFRGDVDDAGDVRDTPGIVSAIDGRDKFRELMRLFSAFSKSLSGQKDVGAPFGGENDWLSKTGLHQYCLSRRGGSACTHPDIAQARSVGVVRYGG